MIEPLVGRQLVHEDQCRRCRKGNAYEYVFAGSISGFQVEVAFKRQHHEHQAIAGMEFYKEEIECENGEAKEGEQLKDVDHFQHLHCRLLKKHP